MIHFWAGLAIVNLLNGKYGRETIKSIGWRVFSIVMCTWILGWYLAIEGGYAMSIAALDHVGY